MYPCGLLISMPALISVRSHTNISRYQFQSVPALLLACFLVITHDFHVPLPISHHPSLDHLTFLISIGNTVIISCTKELGGLTIMQCFKTIFPKMEIRHVRRTQCTIFLGKHDVFTIFKAQGTNQQTNK